MDSSGERDSAILAVQLGGSESQGDARPAASGLFTRILGEHDGRLLRRGGGLSCAVFPTSSDAVSCALDLEATLSELPAPQAARPARFRAGIAPAPSSGETGRPAADPADHAARLAEIARPGRICISAEIYEGLSSAQRRAFQDIGVVDAGGDCGEVHCYETAAPVSRSSGGVGTGGESTRGRGAGEESDAEAAAEAIAELKSIVAKYAKKAGSKVSADTVRRLMPNRGADVDRAIDRLAELGYLRKGPSGSGSRRTPPSEGADWGDWREGVREYGRDRRREIRRAVRDAMHEEHRHHHEHDHDLDESAALDYADYRKRVIARADRSISGLVPHLVTYIIINGGLLFLNLAVSPHFPWFAFPAGGWGIGVVSHIAAVVEQRRRKRDVEALPEQPGEEDAALIRRYHRARGGARATFFSLASVSLFLALINLITSPTFPWALFPFAGMLIGMVSSYAAYLPVRHAFRKRRKLMAAAAPPAAPSFAAEEGDDPLVRRAAELAEAIMEQSQLLRSEHAPLVEDLRPLLGDYVGRVRMLTARSREVERIISGVPRRELEQDLLLLRKRYETTESRTLKEEYRKSIEAIERQNRSVEELQSQKELLDLKVANSLASLKQMRIDLARMAGVSADSTAGDAALKQKAEELSHYIHDLTASYEELEEISGSGELELLSADELLKRLEASEHPPKRRPEQE